MTEVCEHDWSYDVGFRATIRFCRRCGNEQRLGLSSNGYADKWLDVPPPPPVGGTTRP